MAGHRWIRAPHRAARAAAVTGVPVPLAVVDADRRRRGPYTGVGTMLRAIVPDALARDRDLVIRHNIEILATTPELRHTVPATRETLTSLAVPDERTRFYSRLRTLRITHGLIEFLVDYVKVLGPEPRSLVFHEVHEADPTDREFVAVLARRVDPELLTLVVTTGHDPLTDPVGPIAVPLAPALTRYCIRTDVDAEPSVAPGDAQTYVDSDGTSDHPADLAAYQELSAAERAQLHDERAAVLEERGESSLLLGAVPYHRERGADPTGAAVRALRHAVDTCMDLGYYHAVVDLGTRGRALADPATDVENWWGFTTRMTTALAALGRPEESLALYDSVRAETQSPSIHMQAAYATSMLYTRHFEEDRRDHRLARAWSNQAIAIAGLLPEAKSRAFNTVFNRNGLALIEFHQNRPEEALRVVDGCIAHLDEELDDGEQMLHRSVLRYNRAQVLAALKRYEQAVADYTEVIALDPNYAEYHFDRAALYRKLGRTDEAMADYHEAIRLSPPFPEAYYNRGDLRAELGDVAGARADFDYTLVLEPDFVDAYVNRAGIRQAEGDVDGAVEDAMAGLARDPENAHLYTVLGQAYAELGKDVEARAAFDRAVAAKPDLTDALAGRASLAYDRGDLESAIADLRRAVELRPDDAALLYNRAFVYRSSGQWERALADLTKAVALSPDDPDVTEAYESCRAHVMTTAG